MVGPRLFGTNGIRGVVGRDIDAEFAYGMGCSLATLFRRGRVLTGRDGRTSSKMLSEAVIGGLLAQGAGVDDCGLITTPALQFLVKNTSASGGVMVTASHNPPEYNGFKVVDYDGIEIAREKEEKVEALVRRDSWKATRLSGKRKLSVEPLQPYLARLEGQIEKERGKLREVKVVVDVGNGVSTLTTPVLLKRLGCEVLTVNDNIDGGFPGRSSEPGPETLGTLSRMVRESKADLGVAHDGDGDRAIFTDETGTVHWGDRSLALVVDDILTERPGGKVVTPVNSSLALREIVGKRKGKLILTKVGSIFVSRRMVETGAVLGGEENGGIFYSPHQPVRDGTMATLLVLKALARSDLPLSKLLDRLPKLVMAKEKFLCKTEASKRRAMTKLKAKLKNRVTSSLDGLRVDVKDRGWVLVRPSGTEPLLRLYAEGWTKEDLSVLMDEFKPLVLSSLEP